jgi:hypothetical protein
MMLRRLERLAHPEFLQEQQPTTGENALDEG